MTKNEVGGTMGDGFKPAPVPDNEAERLREVSMLDLTEINAEDPNLNDIIRIACAVTDTPIAMVNILDRPDQHTCGRAACRRRLQKRYRSKASSASSSSHTAMS